MSAPTPVDVRGGQPDSNAALSAPLIRWGRVVGVSFLAGILAGIAVGGLGGRLVMRLIAIIIGPAFTGRITDNGNAVGDFTLQGTFELILFAGVAQGLVGGAVLASLRPWLASLGRWRGLGFGVLLLLVLGFTVITPDNPDFRRFGSPVVNVALFAAIFVGFGVLLDWVATALEKAAPGGSGRRSAARIAFNLSIAGAFLLGSFLIISLAVTTVRTLIGAAEPGTGFGVAKSLVVLGILGGSVLARRRREPAWRWGVMAVPMVAGLWLTATSVARIVGLTA